MSNKARKYVWPGALVMSIAIVGVLAALFVLGSNPAVTDAHGGAQDSTHCAGMSRAQQLQHDLRATDDAVTDAADQHTCDDASNAPADDMSTGNGGNGNGMVDVMHATKPQNYQLQGLDNGARLDWDAPYRVAKHAMVSGYQIERDAWNAMAHHPINMYGDTTIMVGAHETDRSDLGLAYETVYQYRVRAQVQYNVEGWWNMLNCVEMNDAVSPTANEPAVGADTDGTTYCEMYDDLSDAAMVVVRRAYAALDPMAYTYYGEWSMMRAIETADSGGRLMALLDPPSAVRSIGADPACDDRITVRWQSPSSWGTVPATDKNGVYVGPDYIGADDAGREEVGKNAAPGIYQVQRMVNNGPWASVTPVGMTYTDSNVAYGSAYEYRVRAMNSHGLSGPWVMVMEDLTEPDEPNMPRSLNVDPVNGTVELQWDAPTDNAGLWRTMVDFNRAGDESGKLSYVIERKVGAGSWTRIHTQKHRYADGFHDTLTQAYTDKNPPVGMVSYRVAAIVDGCNPSPYNQKDPVTVTAASLGTVSDLAFSASAQLLTWTAPAGAVRQFAIVVNAADDTDFCLGTLNGTASSYTCTDIDNTAGSVYVGLVIAQDSAGTSTVGNFPTHRVQ